VHALLGGGALALIGLAQVGLVRLTHAFGDTGNEDFVVACVAFAMALASIAVFLGVFFTRPGGEDDDEGPGDDPPEPPQGPQDPPWWDDFERDLRDWSEPGGSPAPPPREPVAA
jgi:hypothetical protein